jgi:V/A-type H+-transporting ATPase subunit I
MAIVEMQKIRLFIHRSKATDVLRAIQKLGVVEFVDVTEENDALTKREKTAFEFNYVSSRLDFAVNFLSQFETPKGSLANMIEGSKVRISGTDLYKTANAFYYNDVVDAAQEIEKKLVNAKNKLSDLAQERSLLVKWADLPLSLGTPRETNTTRTIFITGKKDSFDLAIDALVSQNIPHHITSASETHRVLTYFTDHEISIEKILRERSVDTVQLPKRRGTPKEEIDRIDRATNKEREKIARRELRAKELAQHLPQLKIVSDYIFWQKNKHDLMSESLVSSNTMVFEGWCPTSKIGVLEERIHNKTPYYALEKISPQQDEVPPVEIENNSLIKPFEAVTRLYGLPGHTDLDPTIFLAGFFFLFFGLALTDFGYGAFLVLVVSLIFIFYKVPKDLKPMLLLILFVGLSTMGAGMLFGGYFGIDPAQFPAWVRSIQQFDPIKNPIPVFYLALSLGVIQILFGLVLKIVSEIKNGRVWSGIFDRGPWVGLFVAGILYFGNSLGMLPGAPTVYVYSIYTMIALIVLVGMFNEKNWLLKPFKGILSLYDIVGYFSDILSYSRLLALGLSTSALAFAINLIADMVKGVPYVGLLLFAIIFIIGHMFNLAVNLLGAFVHSARLQFVEFFSKFISGSGRNFKPFRREERFVSIEESP